MAFQVRGLRGQEFDRGYQDGYPERGRVYLGDNELDAIYEAGYIAGAHDGAEPCPQCPECNGEGAPHDGGPCPHCIAIRRAMVTA